jgi:hypothetical protein
VLGLFVSAIFAVSQNYVALGGHYDNNGTEIVAEELYYQYEDMYIPVPVPEVGYTWSFPVPVARSVGYHTAQYDHGVLKGPVIGVYVYANNTEWYNVSVINAMALANGQNETQIQSGFTSSPFVMDEWLFTNGDKIVFYQIPDLSSSTIRVRVTTCPRFDPVSGEAIHTPANTHGVFCQSTFAFLRGY